MAEARISMDQDEFLCPVCLDLLKDPVAIPCGHSYCKICITDCWDQEDQNQEDQKRVYSCPQCRQTFSPRPALARNTMLTEVVEKLKKTRLSADCYAGAGDVQCDVCTGRKYKALKSCLVCLDSYCQNHLEQHESWFKGKKHNLTDATGRLQEMICQKHEKILEVFCRTDQKCICVLCTMDDHKNHDTVSAAAQRTEKQKQLKETQKTLQQRIQQREKDLQQLRETVESHKRSAQTAVEDSERIFTELIRSIERSRSELIQLIRDQEKTAVSRAEERLERLEQEINDLRRRDAELEQLSHTQDHIQFLQSFQSLSAPPESTDVNDDLFNSLFSFDDLRESVHQLRDKLEDFCKEELKKISDRAGVYYHALSQFTPPFALAPIIMNPAPQQLKAPPPHVQQAPPRRKRRQLRIRDPNQGGRDITEELMSGHPSGFTLPPPQLSCCVFVSLYSCSKMAEARVSQDEFLCPVCLDLLKDPVAIPCGHSYCKICITDCWDQEDQKRVYSCPQCRQTFSPRPALARNTMLAEVVEKLKKIRLSADCYAGAGDVQCDVCTGRKYKAVKSCLMCLNSYCQNHLEQHESWFNGKKHNLTDATGRLQEMICQKHEKILEVFCRTDQECICVLCTINEHKNHDTVSAAAQRTEKQKQLKETQKTLQQRIQQREKDLQQLRETVESHKRSAQTAVEDSERIFTELIRSIERSRSELIQLIRDQEKTAVSRAEERLERLEQEINDLRRRDAELEQLSHTQDHIQFLQSFQSLSAPPESTDVNDDLFSSLVTFDDLRESVHQLRDKLEDFCKEELKKISDRVTFTNIVPRTRNDFLQYSRQLTLDPNTVNNYICLSESNRVITVGNRPQYYPDHPERFDVNQVLCRESVYGRCYWEIEWSGSVFISVSYKSISRKGTGHECVFGYNDQSWNLDCSPSSYLFRHNNIKTDLSVKYFSSRIGVFVDHSAGTLSFYSVSDTMSLIHTVQTTFTQTLYPGFYVGSIESSVKLCW
ncbi:E3 ubiquitin/ISG15 ligase TRIM25-like [Carassius carassius]|uniref:E3 ubiquitin/ISG15 ligase TRIM25-like n=1 Tax=Carassius carassius TaxID=217509 RepID=UPI0028685F39|nr:E3 ubiquitin/ISG15 ligase TRIM25-like [Carassius carassius]